jgi:hypothetical protein
MSTPAAGRVPIVRPGANLPDSVPDRGTRLLKIEPERPRSRFLGHCVRSRPGRRRQRSGDRHPGTPSGGRPHPLSVHLAQVPNAGGRRDPLSVEHRQRRQRRGGEGFTTRPGPGSPRVRLDYRSRHLSRPAHCAVASPFRPNCRDVMASVRARSPVAGVPRVPGRRRRALMLSRPSRPELSRFGSGPRNRIAKDQRNRRNGPRRPGTCGNHTTPHSGASMEEGQRGQEG